MKNLKNMAAALGLMAVLGFGAVSANAGIMITDRQAPCTTESSSIRDLSAIAAVGLPMFDGIIIIGRDGLMITDKADSCTSRDGIMITD